MIAFDYDKGNPINEYDVIKNININYHCLLRIVYYFTNLE